MELVLSTRPVPRTSYSHRAPCAPAHTSAVAPPKVALSSFSPSAVSSTAARLLAGGHIVPIAGVAAGVWQGGRRRARRRRASLSASVSRRSRRAQLHCQQSSGDLATDVDILPSSPPSTQSPAAAKPYKARGKETFEAHKQRLEATVQQGHKEETSTLTPVMKLRSLNVLCPAYKRTVEGREEDNEEEWMARLEDLLRLEELWDGDIIALQEVFLANPDYVNAIVTRHAGEFAFYGFQRGFDQETVRPDGLLIGVRRDMEVVLQKEIDFEDVAGRGALLLHVRRGGDEFIIVTTHLLFPYTKSANIIRLRQACKLLDAVQAFRREYAPSVPAIITGDFNGAPKSPVGLLMQAEGWRSSYADVEGSWDSLVTHKTHLGDVVFCDYLWLQEDGAVRDAQPYWPNLVFSEIVERFNAQGCTSPQEAWKYYEEIVGDNRDHICWAGLRTLLGKQRFFDKGQPQITEAEVWKMLDGLGSQKDRIEKAEWEVLWNQANEVKQFIESFGNDANCSNPGEESQYEFIDAAIYPSELAEGEWPEHWTVSDHGVVAATLASREVKSDSGAGHSSNATSEFCEKMVCGEWGSFNKECLANPEVVSLLRSSREDCTMQPWTCHPKCKKAQRCEKVSHFVRERACLDYTYHKRVCYARQLVQDKILHECLPDVQLSGNWVILMAGAIGVGKTHIRRIITQMYPKLGGFVTVDYDEIRSQLPEWEPLLDQATFSEDAPQTAPVKTQAEVRMLGELLQRHAFRRGSCLLIDGSFHNHDWWLRQIQEMQSPGFMPGAQAYKVGLFYVYGPGKDVINSRIDVRQSKEQRGVDMDVFETSLEKVPGAVARLKEVVNLYAEFYNGTDNPGARTVEATQAVVRDSPMDECIVSMDLDDSTFTVQGSLIECESHDFEQLEPVEGSLLKAVALTCGFANDEDLQKKEE